VFGAIAPPYDYAVKMMEEKGDNLAFTKDEGDVNSSPIETREANNIPLTELNLQSNTTNADTWVAVNSSVPDPGS